MYGYEDKTYNEVLTQAVNNIEEINQAVDAICEKGYKNLYLVGTGGTYAMASPLSYLIKTNSTIPWYYEIAAELVTAKPKQLTKDSVVITASLSGTIKCTLCQRHYDFFLFRFLLYICLLCRGIKVMPLIDCFHLLL